MSSTMKERLLAAAAGAAVLLAGLGVGTSAQADTPETTNTTTTWDGSLTWGVKESFRTYVTGPIAGGTITASDGATLPSGQSGAATFALAAGQSFDPDNPGELAFAGTVFFSGHEGILEVKISDPVIDFGTNSLKATVSSRPFRGMTQQEMVDYGQMTIATLSGLDLAVDGDNVSVTANGAVLTSDGVPAFAGFYAAGTSVDTPSAALTKTVTTIEPEEPAPTEDSTQEDTSKPSESPSAPETTTPSEPTTPDDTGEATVPVASGLTWSIKKSFITYIAGSGTITASDGATFDNASSAFTFSLAAGQTLDSANLSTVNFTGSAHLLAHGGVLDITITNPSITKTDDGWVLSALSASRQRGASEPTSFGVIPLVSLEGFAVTDDGKFAQVTFTRAVALKGMTDVFSYAVGTELDAPVVAFSTAIDEPSEEPTTPGGETTPSAPTKPSTPGASASPSNDDGVVTPAGESTTKECTVDATKTRVTSGSFSWGVKSSFTSYITSSIANGNWTLNGVTRNSGVFTFSATGGTFDTSARTGTIYFGGSIHFTGHEGILDLTMSQPALVVNGNSGSLYLTVTGSDMQGNAVNVGRVNFATVALSQVSVTNGSLSFGSSSVSLTAAGAQAFAGFYEAGTALDNFTASAVLTPSSSCDPTTGEKTYYDAFGNVTSELAYTGSGDSSAVALMAIAFIAVGAFGVAVRRKARS